MMLKMSVKSPLQGTVEAEGTVDDAAASSEDRLEGDATAAVILRLTVRPWKI